MTPRQARLLAVVERELALPRGSVSPAFVLAEHGDSLDSFTLLNAVEDEFDLRIPDGVWNRLRTVADLMALVDEPVTSR